MARRNSRQEREMARAQERGIPNKISVCPKVLCKRGIIMQDFHKVEDYNHTISIKTIVSSQTNAK